MEALSEKEQDVNFEVSAKATRNLNEYERKRSMSLVDGCMAEQKPPLMKEGSMVKWLRHRPFTAVTRVQIPLESLRVVSFKCAVVAQLAEQLICNQQVTGSSPVNGFKGPLAQLVRAIGS